MPQKLNKYLVALVALIIPFSIISSTYNFTFSGITLTFVLLSTFTFYYSPKNLQNFVYYIFCLTFSTFLVLRANSLLTFFNLLATTYSLSFLIINPTAISSKFRIFKIIFHPIITFFKLLSTKKDGFYDGFFQFKFLSSELSKFRNKKGFETEPTSIKTSEESQHGRKLQMEIILSLILISVIVPLLASANPIFNNLVKNVLNLFNFFDLSYLIQTWANILVEIYSAFALLRGVLFVFLIFCLPNVILLKKQANDEEQNISDTEINHNLFYPKITTFITLFVFIITQFQLYLASREYLISLGYTYGQLVNEVFFQLSLVSLIILGLVYFENTKKKFGVNLSYLLIFECFLLLFFAFKSDFDYVSYWGLTEKRLYGFAVIAWLTGIYALLALKITRLKINVNYVFSTITYSLAIFIIINMINFDYQIFKVNKPRETTGIAYSYLASLSTDSESYTEIYNTIKNLDQKDYTTKIAQSRIESKINYLQNKYGSDNFDWRTFNLSEYLEYQNVKDLDI